MKVYTSNDFAGYWAGTAAVIVAPDEESAREALLKELKKAGIKPRPGCNLNDFTLVQVNTGKAYVRILQNGDY